MTLCPKCGRENDPWPIRRPNRCSPKHWALCIRQLPSAIEVLACQVRDWWQEMDPFQFAKPCWQNQFYARYMDEQ